MKTHLLTLTCTLFALTCSLTNGAEAIDFNRDIRPILSGKCFKCHGPDAEARKAKLRLDQRDSAIASEAFIPGKPSESLLLELVSTHDKDDRMPPKGDPLSSAEIALLKAWIEDGANYEAHWSYQQPTQPARPSVRDESWPANELDFHILNRIEQAGFSPSPQSDPAVLLRRLYLDIVGLPPSVDEVTAFEADPTRKNFEAHVDRLLQSEHFGEKWAAGWLDLARYADSNGYQHDDLRTMWPYRDWVIKALNDDMPFDQFTIEQLAGDHLAPFGSRSRKAHLPRRRTRLSPHRRARTGGKRDHHVAHGFTALPILKTDQK